MLILTKNPIVGKCEAQVSDHDSRWPQHYQCHNRVKVTRDGHGYCGAHDPEKLAAKSAKREEAYQAREREWDRAARERKATATLIATAEAWVDEHPHSDHPLVRAVATLRAARRPTDAV